MKKYVTRWLNYCSLTYILTSHLVSLGFPWRTQFHIPAALSTTSNKKKNIIGAIAILVHLEFRLGALSHKLKRVWKECVCVSNSSRTFFFRKQIARGFSSAFRILWGTAMILKHTMKRETSVKSGQDWSHFGIQEWSHNNGTIFPMTYIEQNESSRAYNI